MQVLPMDGEIHQKVLGALSSSPLFSMLQGEHLEQVALRGQLEQYEAGECVVEEGAVSDAFFVILSGECGVSVAGTDLGTLASPESIGEMGILLDQARTATVTSTQSSLLLRFTVESFNLLYERVQGFGLVITRALAHRLSKASRRMPLPMWRGEATAEARRLLPLEVCERHRLLPVSVEQNILTVGFVDDPTPAVLNGIRQHLPGMQITTARLESETFSALMGSSVGLEGFGSVPTIGMPVAGHDDRALALDIDPASAGGIDLIGAGTLAELGQGEESKSPKLDMLLRRMVAEGASDVHLSGGQTPRWRIDGEIYPIVDVPPLPGDEIYDLFSPLMDERIRKEFIETNDADFAYAIPGLARFRVNVFRDRGGIGAVLRQIPATILTLEQLNLPPIVQQLCEQPKGLVLVTGPTGSGKSTTLAAMIDYINKKRRAHIITLEDPVEFVHQSLGCLVNQREVGTHTQSFTRALKAALREDPDIVLVGELRDLETVALAVETANTGHLVFGTLHTATAISTVDRIIDLFPAAQQNQIRTVLSESLKGVVAQTLCKRKGGGRVAALEVLVVNHAVSNLVREGKTHQILSIMSTQRQVGNQLLNEQLAGLVQAGTVEYEEASAKALDKADLAKRCTKRFP
ncbi:MAG: PilT/PilU family type 4a pilus ATPase [Deltaproteobacteria bacterium]|nr:PilT/PilU family type 4a pilus ATPase [Deltaproteobacteria bacterium]